MHVSCGRILRGRTDFGMANSVKPVEITDANFSAEIGKLPRGCCGRFLGSMVRTLQDAGAYP